MKFLRELNITNNYLFCLLFAGISALSSILLPLSDNEWQTDGISTFLFLASIIFGITAILISINLVQKKNIWHKIFGIIFILLVIIFFGYNSVDFISYLLSW